MAASFAAFDLSAAALPLPQLELVTATLANLFRCSTVLCVLCQFILGSAAAAAGAGDRHAG